MTLRMGGSAVNDPARLTHLNRAYKIFSQLEAVYDLARVQAAGQS
ncbi:MAG: class III bacteriocin [Anaerolineae bacterium]|nr:class III bacteriocin [Anaerolineae bacterium]